MAHDTIVLATRSEGKVRELRALLSARGIASEDVGSLGIAIDPREDGIESFDTFEANARAKAEWFSRLLPGRAVLAEDSGLEVMALGGAPGVRSKRYAADLAMEGASAPTDAAAPLSVDESNNRALAAAMRGARDRRARYRCVAVLVRDGESRSASGECAGRIVEAPRGSGGFGYDPWFLSDELGVTFAEASPDEKARVSHRARAIARLFAGG